MRIDGGNGPACDGKLFLIEVTGLSHETTQDFLFYSLDNMQEQECLGKKKERPASEANTRNKDSLWDWIPFGEEIKRLMPLEDKKETDKELKDATIYSWDWKDEKENRNVWLNVESDGAPIRLPLFSNVTHTKRQEKHQNYQVQAFLPLTLLPTFDKNIAGSRQKDKERTAPVRNGYIYIAYNGQIWREVEVTSTDAGLPCFKDVHLLNYREGYGKPFKTNTRREVTGKPLKERDLVSVPCRWETYRCPDCIFGSAVEWFAAELSGSKPGCPQSPDAKAGL